MWFKNSKSGLVHDNGNNVFFRILACKNYLSQIEKGLVRLYPDSWIYSACSLALPSWNWLLKQDNGQHTKPDASFFVLHFKKSTGPEWKLILISNF